MPGQPDPTNAPRRTALLVIDVQNDVVANAYDRDGVIDRIGTLIRQAKAAGAPVIWVQHQDDELAPDTEGWQIVEAIRPGPDDLVVAKRFQDSFVETTLRRTLDDLGVGHLVVAGAQTDACIRASTMRALIEGFDLTLVEDAHTTEDTMFDLSDGEQVPVSAKQIVAHTNLCMWSVRYPGLTSTVVPHDKVEFVA